MRPSLQWNRCLLKEESMKLMQLHPHWEPIPSLNPTVGIWGHKRPEHPVLVPGNQNGSNTFAESQVVHHLPHQAVGWVQSVAMRHPPVLCEHVWHPGHPCTVPPRVEHTAATVHMCHKMINHMSYFKLSLNGLVVLHVQSKVTLL